MNDVPELVALAGFRTCPIVVHSIVIGVLVGGVKIPLDSEQTQSATLVGFRVAVAWFGDCKTRSIEVRLPILSCWLLINLLTNELVTLSARLT